MSRMVVGAVIGSVVTALTTHWVVSKQSESVAPTKTTTPEARKPAQSSTAAVAATERRELPTARIYGAVAEAERAPADSPVGAETQRPTLPSFSPEEHRAFSEFSFEQEAVDIGWARETESLIHGTLRTLPDIQVIGAECRSTMCRFEVAYKTKSVAETFEIDYVQHEPFSNTTAFLERTTGPDGLPSGLLVLFARQGHSLPRLTREATAPED